MNTLVILVIIILVCVAVDIINLIITIQLMVRLGDLVAQLLILPSIQVKEDTSLTVFANHHVL
jgi:hypothetical protein